MRNSIKKITLTFLVVTVSCFLIVPAHSEIPHLINYQGRLTDSSGSPVGDGAYNITFRIYDDPNTGTLLWEEERAGVQVQKGIFNIMLGSERSLNLPFDKPYYLEMVVNNEKMLPRQQITSAGYAFRAEKADLAENATQAQNANKLTGNLSVENLNSATNASSSLLGFSCGTFPSKLFFRKTRVRLTKLPRFASSSLLFFSINTFSEKSPSCPKGI